MISKIVLNVKGFFLGKHKRYESPCFDGPISEKKKSNFCSFSKQALLCNLATIWDVLNQISFIYKIKVYVSVYMSVCFGPIGMKLDTNSGSDIG